MSNIVTPEFRAAWVNAIKPRKNDNGEDRWGVTALFPKGCDLSILKKAAKEACIAKWGENPKKWPQKLKTPFHDQGTNTFTNDAGEEQLYSGYEDGAIYVNLSSKYPPEIMDKKTKSEIIDESEVYSGCWMQASVEVYAYDHPKGGRGVALGLRNLLKTRDDTPFGKVRVSAKEEFEALCGTSSEEGTTENTDSDNIFN